LYKKIQIQKTFVQSIFHQQKLTCFFSSRYINIFFPVLTFRRTFDNFFAASKKQQQHLEKYKHQFVLHILRQCYQLSQKNNKLLFWYTLLHDWFGSTWTEKSLLQEQQLTLPKSTFRNLKTSCVEVIKSQLQQLLTTIPVTVYWMDNFSKVYVRDYNWKWAQIPWELRNLTAVAVFVSEIPLLQRHNQRNISFSAPLPKYNKKLWKEFYESFLEKVETSVTLFYLLESYTDLYPSATTSPKMNLHTTFRPLELTDFNPQDLEGNLSTLTFLKKHYPTNMPFTVVVADIAFVTKFWKFTLSSTGIGKHSLY